MPMSVILTAGQAGDNPQLVPLLDGIEVARLGGGRPRSRPDAVVADKAYSHRVPVSCCGGAGSGSPVRNGRIRRPAGRRKAPVVGVHRRSTGSSTQAATSSSAASTGSNTSVTWPLVTPNELPISDPS